MSVCTYCRLDGATPSDEEEMVEVRGDWWRGLDFPGLACRDLVTFEGGSCKAERRWRGQRQVNQLV